MGKKMLLLLLPALSRCGSMSHFPKAHSVVSLSPLQNTAEIKDHYYSSSSTKAGITCYRCVLLGMFSLTFFHCNPSFLILGTLSPCTESIQGNINCGISKWNFSSLFFFFSPCIICTCLVLPVLPGKGHQVPALIGEM